MGLQGREVSDELSLVLVCGTLCIAAGLWIWLTLLERFSKNGRAATKAIELRAREGKKRPRKRR